MSSIEEWLVTLAGDSHKLTSKDLITLKEVITGPFDARIPAPFCQRSYQYYHNLYQHTNATTMITSMSISVMTITSPSQLQSTPLWLSLLPISMT